MDELDLRWFAAQLPGRHERAHRRARSRRVGHSAETLLVTLGWSVDGSTSAKTSCCGCARPPGLLEPYDLRRQFAILRGLEGTPCAHRARSGSKDPAPCSGVSST